MVLEGNQIMPAALVLQESKVYDQQVDFASPARCGLAWHPDGSLLALSDTSNGITLYEKLSWDPIMHLDGHTAPMNSLEFSPNGIANFQRLLLQHLNF